MLLLLMALGAAALSTPAADGSGTSDGALTTKWELTDREHLRIRVANETKKRARVHDPFSRPGATMPAGFAVMVSGVDGAVLSKRQGHRGGYVGLNYIESDLLFLPAPLRTLEPGETIQKDVWLVDVIGDVERAIPAVRAVDRCFLSFRLRLCRDSFLKKCVKAHSPAFEVDLQSLRSSAKNTEKQPAIDETGGPAPTSPDGADHAH
jgi:hypothetical protein